MTQNTAITSNPEPAGAAGAPSNPPGPIAPAPPASPTPGQPQGPTSGHADELTGIKQLLGTVTEHLADQDARLAGLERAAKAGASLDAEQAGDVMAQVHTLTAYVRGVCQKVGYIHKPGAGG